MRFISSTLNNYIQCWSASANLYLVARLALLFLSGCVCVDWSAFNWGESELKKSGVKHQVVDIDIQSDP